MQNKTNNLIFICAVLMALLLGTKNVSAQEDIAPEGFEYVDSLVFVRTPAADSSYVGKDVFDLDVDQSEAIENAMRRHIKANPDRVVLIDEAYVDFGAESSVALTKKYDNLLVVCTYSKSRSMAGARLGFAIGNEGLIADLEKIKYSTNPYNINRLTMLAGIEAIKDNEYYVNNCKTVAENREYTQKKLVELGFEVTPSKANFIFAKSERIDGEELYLKLKARGILVRHFTANAICQYNRITVGTREQMDKMLDVTADILNEKENSK